MTLGTLNVHFASEQQASALAAGASFRVATISGQPAEREELFAALGEALALPEYFGHNWDAVADCLTDLPPTVLIVPAMLWQTSPGLATMLVDVWLTAGEEQQLVFVRREP
jgi:RNAse (barnase) inhibitor barstar